MNPDVLTSQVVSHVVTARDAMRESALEKELSVNDFIDNIRGACIQAQQLARAGSTQEEFKAWLDVAAIALTRAEQVFAVIQEL